jgi:toxin-antitoxin system PIN domain toxin
VFIYAVQTDSKSHTVASGWLAAAGDGDEVLGIPGLVLSAFVRISTNRRMVSLALSVEDAFSRCQEFLAMPAAASLDPGAIHWDIFRTLVLESGVSGPHVSDAYLAAFAIENHATFVTFDRGFRRFEGLKLQVLE